MTKSTLKIEKIENPPVVKIKSLKSYRNKILDLSQGVPWFDPPVKALNSAMEKISKGEGNRYSPDQGRETLRILLKSYLKNFDINCTEKINISPLEGAFYMLISFKDLKGVSGWDIAERILSQYGIVTLPGELFGLVNEASLRLSYGNIRKIDIKLLKKAMKSVIKER